jgi:cytochrome b561
MEFNPNFTHKHVFSLLIFSPTRRFGETGGTGDRQTLAIIFMYIYIYILMIVVLLLGLLENYGSYLDIIFTVA